MIFPSGESVRNSIEGWFNLVRILLAEDYLVKDEDYSVLSLTQKAKEELQARTSIMLPFNYEKDNSAKKEVKEKSKPQTFENNLDGRGKAIVNALKQKRRELADEARVPAYVIFSDKTIFDLGVKKPATIAELDNIFGIGKAKKDKYGDIILKTISSARKSK